MTAMLRASTFVSDSAAQFYVQGAVDRHRDLIALWLAGGQGDRLVLSAVFPGEVTGRLLPHATALAGGGPFDVRAIRVVLARDADAANGFVVRSAYPTED